jgi:hypothetical protein
MSVVCMFRAGVLLAEEDFVERGTRFAEQSARPALDLVLLHHQTATALAHHGGHVFDLASIIDCGVEKSHGTERIATTFCAKSLRWVAVGRRQGQRASAQAVDVDRVLRIRVVLRVGDNSQADEAVLEVGRIEALEIQPAIDRRLFAEVTSRSGDRGSDEAAASGRSAATA